jgi:hypothetical protein
VEVNGMDIDAIFADDFFIASNNLIEEKDEQQDKKETDKEGAK